MGNLIKKHARAQQSPQNRVVVPNHMVLDSTPAREHPNIHSANNKIKTTKYTLLSFFPKNLFEQFHRFANIYFVFIVLLNWIPVVNAFAKEVAMVPVIFVLSVTAIKDAFEDYRRYRSDKRINHQSCHIYSKHDRRYMKKEWADVRVGDILYLSCNEVIPADIVVLRSSDENCICHIDTSNLDGESNLKQREVVNGIHLQGAEFHPSMFTYKIECELPNMEIYHFSGSMMNQMSESLPIRKNNLLLRGCIIRNTDFVEGIVVYAGHDTKALLNNRGPRSKRSKLERQINRDVVWCVVLLFVMCFGCALGTGIWLDSFEDNKNVYFIPFSTSKEYDPAYQGFVRFWTYVILFQVMIPLSLYVTIELVKIGQVYFIQNDKELYHEESDRRIECRALNITEDLGQVQHVFSDKTGTLTENRMEFKRCTIGGTDYSPRQDTALYQATGKGKPSSTSSLSELEDDDDDLWDSRMANGHLGMSNPAFIPDPVLRKEVSRMSLNRMEEVELELSQQSQRIRNFFLLMAICNTVVVSRATAHSAVALRDSDQVTEEEEEVDKNPATNGLGAKTANGGILRKKVKQKKANTVYKGAAEKHASQLPLHDEDELEGAANSVTRQDNQTLKLPNASTSRASTLSETALKMKYEAESPDELALVKACCTYGCRLIRRSPDTVTVWLPAEGEITIRILHILHFDSDRKRMSVIIQHPATKEIILFCKGADTAIIPHVKHDPDDPDYEKLLDTTQQHLTNYAKQGLRTLCMAKRVIPPELYKIWANELRQAEADINNTEKMVYRAACNIETELELLGATGIEDKLQDGVPETIAALREAGLSVWVLTGDKQETALNIAYSCQLISFDQEVMVMNARNKEMAKNLIESRLEFLESNGDLPLPDPLEETEEETEELEFRPTSSARSSSSSKRSQSKLGYANKDRAMVIDGKTLRWVLAPDMERDFLRLTQFCSSVLCVRATPIQKASVVKLVRDKLHKLTLAIGDGANDVSMIQTADVGIGISGQEGMQAVMASDFALARFRFLHRLLLVHGHWCYDRLAKMALYMFYKNAVFIFMLLWYQLYSGFSGGTFLDDWNLIFFNLLWTSLPPIILGIFDQNLSAITLARKPFLYRRGPKCKAYRKYSYFIQILDAIWQSLVQFFVPYFAYNNSTVGLWEFGVTANTGSVWCALLHACIETKYWSIFHLLGILLSAGIFYIFNVLLGIMCLECSPPANPYKVPQRTFSSPVHWLCVMLIILLALAPRYILRALEGSLWPSPCLLARQMEHRNGAQIVSSPDMPAPEVTVTTTAPSTPHGSHPSTRQQTVTPPVGGRSVSEMAAVSHTVDDDVDPEGDTCITHL